MMTFLMVTFFILLIVALMVAIARRNNSMPYNDYDDEEVVTHTTVTTTTTTDAQPTAPLVATVGTINAFQKAGNTQWYVIDPVDKEETLVDSNDDYYRDAGGKIWELQ
jgi:exosome complex RNA-binding protein Rrp42 (RNase PH superfamily)